MQQVDLSGLKDVHKPDGLEDLISFWPLAWGWWLLLAIIILIPVIIYTIHYFRIRSAKLYALKQLQVLMADENISSAQFATEVSKLLKRISILRFGKDKIASLSDKDWVDFLIKTGDLKLTKKVISLFAYSPYAKIEKSDKTSVESINKAAEIWIKKNT